MRNILIYKLYEKVGRISERALIKTSVGKMTSLASSELLSIETGFTAFPLGFAYPFLNLFAYSIIWSLLGPLYCLEVFLSTMITTIVTMYISGTINQKY